MIKKLNINTKKIIFLSSFLILNIINFEMINTNLYIDIELLPRTFGMVLNCLLGNLGFIFLLIGIGALFIKRDYVYFIYLLLCTSLFCIFLFVVSIYYNHYDHSFPSFSGLEAFTSGDTGDTVTFIIEAMGELLLTGQFLFLLPLIILITMLIVFFRKSVKTDKEFKSIETLNKKNRLMYSSIVIVCSIFVMVSSLKMYNKSIEDTDFDEIHLINKGVQNTGIANYYVYEAITSMFPSKNTDVKMINKLKTELETKNIKLKNNDFTGVFNKKNLLMIQIESLSNYTIGLEIEIDGVKKEVTPFLNSLVNKSAYFSNYYTSVGIGNTSDAEFSVMSGMYPNGYSFSVYDYDDINLETIATLFKEEGYYTVSAHANTGSFYNRHEVHEQVFGFDLHIDEEKLKEEEIYNEDRLIHTWVSDEDLLNYLIKTMNEKISLGTNVFGYGITVSCHTPYNIDEVVAGKKEEIEVLFEGRDRLFPSDYEGPLSGEYMRYLEHVAYTDYALSKALENITEDTIVILYGDHGAGLNIYEAFNENKEIFSNNIQNIPNINNEEFILTNSFMTNVPLFIYDSKSNIFNDSSLDQIKQKTRSHVNLKATICNLFDLHPKYIFNTDALSSDDIFIYNPRNHIMQVNQVVISPMSSKVVYTNNYTSSDIITEEQIKKYIKDFWQYKGFNDRALKYSLFNYLD